MDANMPDIIDDNEFEYDEIECDLTTKEIDSSPKVSEMPEVNDDFETHLPPANDFYFNNEIGEYADVAKYGIVEVAGDDLYGDKIITFSACRVPPSSEVDHQRVLNYLLFTLDKYVSSDYVFVYFHYGMKMARFPSLKFLFSAYRQLDRKYKKNIKALFIVHPSTLINVIIASFQKIVNSKFAKKIRRISIISEMGPYLIIDRLRIPYDVKLYDNSIRNRDNLVAETPAKTNQFGVSLEFIYENYQCTCPPIVTQCIDYISKYGLDQVGIFRRCSNKILLDDVCHNINHGIPVDFNKIGDVDLACVVLKRFFGCLEPALFPDSFNQLIVDFHEETDKLKTCFEILGKLPEINRNLLFVLLDLLDLVQRHSAVNLMTSGNLGIVIGCNLFRPVNGLASLFYINNFVVFLIDNYHNLKVN